MVSVCLPSDALSQHLPSYLGFSYLGHGVSLHICFSKAQLLPLTLDEGSLLRAAPPDLGRGVAPLSPLVPAYPWLNLACTPPASGSCRILSPRKWPPSGSCSVPPHWCSPPRPQPAVWSWPGLLFFGFIIDGFYYVEVCSLYACFLEGFLS